MLDPAAASKVTAVKTNQTSTTSGLTLTLPEVDLGGGYSVAYTDGEDSMDLDTELARLADAVTTVPTEWLNGHHTIFGEVADDESKAVVDTPTLHASES